MGHVTERASTGRAKCRACGTAIAKGDLRVGESVPNIFADAEGAESRHWYHLRCAAYRRPETFLQAIETAAEPVAERDALEAAAQLGVTHHRLARLDKAGRASSARASCRACRTPIAKDSWRLGLLFWQDGRFMPSGFIHAACAAGYLGTADVLDRVRHFTPDLADADVDELRAALASEPPAPLQLTDTSGGDARPES